MREQLRHAPAILLGLALSVGAVEMGLAATSYRSAIADEDFAALTGALVELPAGRLRLGTPWLDSRLRRHLSPEQRRGLVAPDELGRGPLAVVVAAGEEATGLELPASPSSRERFGGLELLRYELPGPQLQLDLLDADSFKLFADDERCRRRKAKAGNQKWDCRPGKLRTGIVEVGYGARRCIVGEGFAGRTLRFELRPPDPQSTRLRGHLGFGDFNARLRSDASVDLRVRQGESTQGHFTVTDDQGWRPFELAIDGQQAVSIELRVSDDGTFDAKGKARSRPPHLFCFEARLFGESSE